MDNTQQGFTLIEIMVVLLVTAIALLALATLSLSVMDSGTESRERLNAVHLAEQVIEEWQRDSNDELPTINTNCSMDASSASQPVTSGTSISQTCNFASGGSSIDFTVKAEVFSANAPLPDGFGGIAIGAMSGTTSFPNTPMVKLVTVSWDHKGEAKSIYLTHLTR